MWGFNCTVMATPPSHVPTHQTQNPMMFLIYEPSFKNFEVNYASVLKLYINCLDVVDSIFRWCQ